MRTGDKRHLTTLITACVLAGFSTSVLASGFRVPEVSVAGLGTANAMVANNTELGALAYNPAAMSFHKGNHLVGGVVAVNPSTKYTDPAGNSTETNNKDLFGLPNLYIMGDLQNNWSWGLGINAPFGLETRWPKDTFASFAGPLDGLEPELSKLQTINFNPNASVKLGKNTSFAFGVDFYDVRDLALSSQAFEITGSGEGIGINLGLMHVTGPWSIGFSYRSSADIDINGTAAAFPATTKLELPSVAQLGAKYQFGKSFSLELDLDWTGWSSFDEIVIDVPTAQGGFPTKITSTNKWDDALAVRLGATWNVTAKTQLRFGYAFDETPQPDEFYSARIPDADRQLLSIGVAHSFGKWSIEAGYMYAFLDDRTINSSKNYITQALGGNPDPNGTDAFNGKYESDVNLLGLGATYSF